MLLNAIFVFQKAEFYQGLLDFLKTENDIEKTLLYKVLIDENPMKNQSDGQFRVL